MHYLFATSLLAALASPLSVIAAPAQTCNKQNVLASAWFEGWDAGSSPSNISWNKYNSVTFAFAAPSNDPSVINVEPATLLSSLVKEGHSHGVNVTVSMGGFSDSTYFSSAVNPQNVSTFVKAVVGLVKQFNVDGVEFDWEFPGSQQSDGCNVVSPNDSVNYLTFLQQLRQDPVGRNITLSAAVGLTPWAGTNGSPMTDVSAFASVLDTITIMSYDIYGSWSPNVGPNSPLNDSCAPAVGDKQGSAASAVSAWTNANFPASQIALGVPSYGHAFRVAPSDAFTSSGTLALFPQFDKSNIPVGSSDPPPNSPPTHDHCGNLVRNSGTFDFKSLINDGFLTANGTNATGIDHIFDTCSETPYIYNASSQIMIAYDDAKSFAAKGKFITANGLKGYNMWYLGGDSNDILVDSINSAVGFQQNCAS